MTQTVSICIPVYNGAKWLRDCLESACAVSVAGEIIVNDDCSTDDSVAIAESFAGKDQRVVVYRNAENMGLVGNWNRCMEFAKLEWIKFLFQDDRLQVGAVESMLQAARPEVSLIAARRNFVYGKNSSAGSKEYYTTKVLTLENTAPGITEFTAERIVSLATAHIARNFIGEPSTVMFRRSVIDRIGKFDPLFKQICDLEYWLRIAQTYGLTYVPDAVIDFAVHDDSVSAQNAVQQKAGFDAIHLVDRMLHASSYAEMRGRLSVAELRRLKLWLRVQTYELRIKSPEAASEFFRVHPLLKQISEKTGNGLLYRLARLRR